MKITTLTLLCLLGIVFNSNAQTEKELLGKWQLIKWTQNGSEKNIQKEYGTEQVFQVFQPDSKFQSIIGEKTKTGKWELLDDNKTLKIKSGVIAVKFNIIYFDEQKRIIKSGLLGTLEYKKES